jgi:hypothetical protein
MQSRLCRLLSTLCISSAILVAYFAPFSEAFGQSGRKACGREKDTDPCSGTCAGTTKCTTKADGTCPCV